jgi:hypothetical protein
MKNIREQNKLNILFNEMKTNIYAFTQFCEGPSVQGYYGDFV